MASIALNSLPLSHHFQSRHFPLFTNLDTAAASVLPSPSRAKPLQPIIVSGNPPTFVSAPGRRTVAVGDIHGNLDQARCALEIGGVLSSDGRDMWTGEETVLIQLGDILDRGEDELAILSLLHSLKAQAKAYGGAVFQVHGNHEPMIVEGDFRYVDAGAFDECANFLDYQAEAKGVDSEVNSSKTRGPLACELALNPVPLRSMTGFFIMVVFFHITLHVVSR